MRKRAFIAGSIIVSLLGLSLVVLAFDHWGGGGPWRGGERMGHGPGLMALINNSRLRTYLDLTDSQVSQLRKIAVDAEIATVKDRADVRVRGIELRELLRAENPDRDAIMQKVQEISQARERLMKQRIDALLAAQKVLTPDQQKKARSFIESHGMWGARRSRFGEHRGGPMMHRPSQPMRPQVPANPEGPSAQ